ncbi:MAG: SPOR domain-containing protein [Bacteroidota bacterium]
MLLSTIISNLLHHHECVIIPEFGAFIANPIGAELNMATRQGHPPRKVLSFNEALQLSDGLLINHIARTQHLSYEQAKDQISTAVQSFKAQIQENGFLTLEGLGRMVRNPEGRLEFNESGYNFQLESFGLPVLDFQPIVRATNEEEKKAIIHQHLKSKTLVRAPNVSKPWIPVAAVATMLLLVLTIGVVQWLNPGMKTTNNQETASITQPLKHPEVEEGTTKVDLNLQDTTALPVDEQDLPEGEKPTISTAPELVDFDALEPYPVKTTPSDKTIINEEMPIDKSDWVRKKIVVGAFGVEQNANRLSEKIRKDGYQTEIRKIGQLFHVRVLVHSAKEEVKVILQEVQDQFNASAWIL